MERQRGPEQRRATPRQDRAAGDVGTLVQLGRMEAPAAPRERQAPAPPQGDVPPAVEAAHRVMLTDALTEAGVTQAAGDTAAVAAAARLDSASVATLARWIRRGRATTDPTPR